jgi:hypothetical protein
MQVMEAVALHLAIILFHSSFLDSSNVSASNKDEDEFQAMSIPHLVPPVSL